MASSEEIAKELTIAVLQKMKPKFTARQPGQDSQEDAGATAEMVATLYRAILHAVNQGSKQ